MGLVAETGGLAYSNRLCSERYDQGMAPDRCGAEKCLHFERAVGIGPASGQHVPFQPWQL